MVSHSARGSRVDQASARAGNRRWGGRATVTLCAAITKLLRSP